LDGVIYAPASRMEAMSIGLMANHAGGKPKTLGYHP